MEGPEDLRPGLQARPASRQSSYFEGLSLPLSFFLGVFLFRLFFCSGLAAGASLCCPYFTEMDFHREMRGYIHILYLHLFLVKLKASMPGNKPLWRL